MSTSRIPLRLLSERFAVCRLAADDAIPDRLEQSSLLSVTRTPSELSVVCRESDDLPGQVEPGWRCLVVDATLDFDEIGVLASLAGPLAEAMVSLFVLSTFDTDYLLVKEEKLETTVDALRAAGHQIL